ncbi:MAG: hypothetical protein JO328_11095 [Hyphomicrobiales bacterium]|nr:hypothetical protein [Hyphomicrobiales bacterium]MBV8827137.1 hypothetical protein [Hyphomicrobiales bacterium]MBV9426738.1 hypothetical protein [Bradyrhizobiaceae bacterium]
MATMTAPNARMITSRSSHAAAASAPIATAIKMRLMKSESRIDWPRSAHSANAAATCLVPWSDGKRGPAGSGQAKN